MSKIIKKYRSSGTEPKTPLERKPVPEDNFKRFHFWVIEQAHMYGVLKDADVKRAIEILLDKLERHIGKPSPAKNYLQRQAWKFFEIFCQKYLHLTDLQYTGNFGPTEIKLVQTLVQKLDDQGISVEEYVVWLFDDFYSNNDLVANIYLSVSNNVLQEFMYKNAHILKQRKQARRAELEEDELLKQASMMIRTAKKEEHKKEVVDVLQLYKNGVLNLGEFAVKMNTLAKKHENS